MRLRPSLLLLCLTAACGAESTAPPARPAGALRNEAAPDTTTNDSIPSSKGSTLPSVTAPPESKGSTVGSV